MNGRGNDGDGFGNDDRRRSSSFPTSGPLGLNVNGRGNDDGRRFRLGSYYDSTEQR